LILQQQALREKTFDLRWKKPTLKPAHYGNPCICNRSLLAARFMGIPLLKNCLKKDYVFPLDQVLQKMILKELFL